MRWPLADHNRNAIQGRCCYGARLPFLGILPRARNNFVDHTVIGQTSAIDFIEDNWSLGRLGNGLYDRLAGPTDDMSNFDRTIASNR